jgi:endonuclease/exonuclease/phosphatase family metal-dependent hydrolase
MGRVFAEMRAAAAPEEDDFLVAGDFNLTFGQLTANLDFGTPLSRPGAQKGSMVKREEDAVGSRMLDHLVVADPCASRELERQQRVLDVWVGLGGARAYYDTVSDHLPVMAYARTGRDEDGCD